MTDFNLFWEAYPRKEAKKRARISFDRAVKDQATLDLILADIADRLRLGVWDLSQKAYIPHPTTYLNGERWEDEVISPGPPVNPGRVTTRDTTLEHDLTDTSWAE